MPLAIICKNRKCGFRHPSELQMDKKAFRITVIQANSEKCPKCGKYALYDKQDYFYIEKPIKSMDHKTEV
jgi:hypothetical protein